MTYVALPVFAFTAAGVSLAIVSKPQGAASVFIGVVIALALAKPVGILLTSWLAAKANVAALPTDATPLAFVGAAFLCCIADPFSFYMAERAFQIASYASVAKIAVLAGSGLAAAFGAIALAFSSAPITPVERRPDEPVV